MPVLIIPSAKLVPEELQAVGKLPGIIYPVNQKIVFDYLFEQYQNICEKIKITCFEAAGKVHRTLEKYESETVVIEDLPELDDLGHTVYYALRDVSGPVYINFSDTIVMDDIRTESGNYFYYAEDVLSDKWTFFHEERGEILSVYDKKDIRTRESGQLFIGLFRIEDSIFLKECLETAFLEPGHEVSSFFRALQMYSRRFPLKAVRAEKWFDIGHADTYYRSNLEVKAREFNHISIDRSRGMLRKTSEDKEKFIGEIKWYLKLPKDIEYARPRIFSYSTSYEEPYVEMEYYAYHTVHEFFLYGDLTYRQWRTLFERIQYVCDDFRRYRVKDADIRKSLEEMYLNKTMQRLEHLRTDENFSEFFRKPVCINGTMYQSLGKICAVLKKEIPERLYDVEDFVIIHGDMCFTNIMVDDNFSFVKLIDPRGKFGLYDIYGDFRYELAKLLHSVDGKYDFIIKGLFTIHYDIVSPCVHFKIQDRERDYDVCEIFKDVFREEFGNDAEKVELIEALLFLSMIPLHRESRDHQMAMLATGLEILDRVLDIRECITA